MITTREHRYPWKGRKRWPNGGRKPARIKHSLSHPLEISIISDVTLIDVISSAASVYWIDDSYYGISVRVSNCRYRYVIHFITIVYYQGQRSVKNLSTAWGSQSLLNYSSGNEVRSSFLFYFLFSSLSVKINFSDIHNTETFPSFIFARGMPGSEFPSILSV